MSWASIVKKFTPEQKQEQEQKQKQAIAISKRTEEAEAVVRCNKGRQWEDSYSNRAAYYEYKKMVREFKARMDNLV